MLRGWSAKLEERREEEEIEEWPVHVHVHAGRKWVSGLQNNVAC